MEQKKFSGRVSGKKETCIAAAAAAGILLAVYLGGAMYFSSHFLPGTEINGKDFSLKTTEDFEKYLENSVQNYRLVITGTDPEGRQYNLSKKDGESRKTEENEEDEGSRTAEEARREAADSGDVIDGRDIELQPAPGGQVEKIMDRQNPLLWPAAFFVKNSEGVEFRVTYNEKLLAEKISSLKVMASGAEGASPAHPVFDGESYVIEPEVYGALPDKIAKKIREYIRELKPELNLMEEGCLEVPVFRSDSPEVEKACEIMNQYCQARVIYTMDQEVTVDAEIISGWLHCDENMNVSLDEEAAGEWVKGLAEQYDTAGRIRSITTPAGKTAEVSGGTYGWKIDITAETAALIENIRKGDVVSREPVYAQRAAVRSAQDWGTTYLEVDLTSQYMWYIQDGAVLLETDVVTGAPVAGKETPQGVYSILYTQQDAVLTGETDPLTGRPEYRTHVDYWMPFTQQGHGFHDADWQSAFGGNVYTYSGSHGCVNMPVDKAGELYAVLETGTPVVVHY